MSPRRFKFGSILAAIALSALTLLAWTQVWFTITLESGQSVAVAGDVAAPALTALALSGLALASALAIAGPVFRVILGGLQAAIGALVVTSAALALGNPITASATAVTAVTGVSGADSVAALVLDVSATAWPAIALVVGLLLTSLGIAIVATARRWPVASRKYQAVQFDDDAVGAWDSLSDGRDPTQRSVE